MKGRDPEYGEEAQLHTGSGHKRRAYSPELQGYAADRDRRPYFMGGAKALTPKGKRGSPAQALRNRAFAHMSPEFADGKGLNPRDEQIREVVMAMLASRFPLSEEVG